MQYINVGKGKIRIVGECWFMPCIICADNGKKCFRSIATNVKSRVIKLKGVKK